MKRIIIILLLFAIIYAVCSCAESGRVGTQTEKDPISAIEEKLVGTWESDSYGHITVAIYEYGGKGRIYTDVGKEYEFTYKILNDHQIEDTMVTIEGVERTTVFEYKLSDDVLIYDDIEYVRKP